MNILNLFVFFSTWVFVIWLIDNLQIVNINKENLITLVFFMFFGAMLLNIYYFSYYSLKDNIRRIPYEIIIHFIPFIYIIKSIDIFELKKILSNVSSYKLTTILCIIYFIINGDSKNILAIYKNPLDYIK